MDMTHLAHHLIENSLGQFDKEMAQQPRVLAKYGYPLLPRKGLINFQLNKA